MEMVLFFWLAFAVVTAIAANARGRSPAAWFAIGAVTGVFGLIAVLVMDRADGPPGRR